MSNKPERVEIEHNIPKPAYTWLGHGVMGGLVALAGWSLYTANILGGIGFGLAAVCFYVMVEARRTLYVNMAVLEVLKMALLKQEQLHQEELGKYEPQQEKRTLN